MPPRRFLRPKFLGIFIAFAIVAGLGVYLFFLPDLELRRAIAEADALDPGWTFEELQRARADVPDDKNGAALILAAAAQMNFRRQELEALNPVQQPTEADLESVRTDLVNATAALTLARGLADRQQGYFTGVAWAEDFIGTLMPHLEKANQINYLLAWDAYLLSSDGDLKGAMDSCRAAINVGRAIGDEPSVISQMVRAKCARQAVFVLEYVLARGQPSANSLQSMQALAALESEEPLQLRATRANRAGDFQFFTFVRSGKFDSTSYGLARPRLTGFAFDRIIDPLMARTSSAPYLRHATRLVQIAKLPTHEQLDRLQELPHPEQEVPAILKALGGGATPWGNLFKVFHRTKAALRCATAALAAERYLHDEGRWPANLDALTPHYLATVPANPYTGEPLKLRRLSDSIVIYAPEKNGPDLNNNLSRRFTPPPGTVTGFQLWDVSKRASKAPGAPAKP